jgi:hypothetical protein
MEQPPKIVQQRLRDTQKPGIHPDPDLLTAFAEKSLNDRERVQVLQHLADCADCREVVSLATPEIKAEPLPSATTSPWLSWPILRWGALAACVVVVGAAVTLHYDRRRSVEPYLAEQVPAAPAAAPENQLPQQPNQKLAAKIAPPSPLETDRDFGTAAGELSKQREKNAEGGVLAGAQVPVPPGALADQIENTPGLTNNRLASSNALKSADKPSQPAGRLAAAAPVPAPSVKTIGAESDATRAQSVTRNDALDSVASTTTETVAAAAPMAQSPERKAKDESNKKALNHEELNKQELTKEALHREGQAARVAAPGAGSAGDRKGDSSAGQKMQAATGGYAGVAVDSYAVPRWTLSAGGVLQRSFDSGKTWQSIPVASNAVFRSLAANNSDIWVGGAAGALYHSSDGGQHWIQVKPVADGKPLTADITAVEFSDAQHGKLTTANREVWITGDAGDSWQVH